MRSKVVVVEESGLLIPFMSRNPPHTHILMMEIKEMKFKLQDDKHPFLNPIFHSLNSLQSVLKSERNTSCGESGGTCSRWGKVISKVPILFCGSLRGEQQISLAFKMLKDLLY